MAAHIMYACGDGGARAPIAGGWQSAQSGRGDLRQLVARSMDGATDRKKLRQLNARAEAPPSICMPGGAWGMHVPLLEAKVETTSFVVWQP